PSPSSHSYNHPSVQTTSHTLSLHDALPILLSASDSDFSANNPPVSRTSTPCRDNWTEARVTPEAVEGSAMLSSPAEAVTGIAISDRKSTRLNSSHEWIWYDVFCLKIKIKRE